MSSPPRLPLSSSARPSSPRPTTPKTNHNPDKSNSLAALVTVFQKDKVAISGPTKSWTGTGTSGNAVHRIFCSECGSPIAHDPEAAPEIIAIKAGTLDWEQKKNLKPVRKLSLYPPPRFTLAAGVERGILRHWYMRDGRRKIVLTSAVLRIPRSGPPASYPSARRASPSLSSICPSNSRPTCQHGINCTCGGRGPFLSS